MVDPAPFGLALLLSGCAALDRLGDTQLTDRVAPVFDPEVPYFPSTDETVLGMLKLAGTGPNDVVYDLGCGDGRIVIAAAKEFGARGTSASRSIRRRCAWRRPVARSCGRGWMPGRTSTTHRPTRRRTTNSINASPGRCQSKTSRRHSSWADSCLWPPAVTASRF